MIVVEREEGLGVVRNDNHTLTERVFTVEVAYKALELNTKRAIGMGTRMPLKMHDRGEVAVKLGRHRFVPKVGTEERMMDFLKRFAGGRSNSSSSR